MCSAVELATRLAKPKDDKNACPQRQTEQNKVQFAALQTNETRRVEWIIINEAEHFDHS